MSRHQEYDTVIRINIDIIMIVLFTLFIRMIPDRTIHKAPLEAMIGQEIGRAHV